MKNKLFMKNKTLLFFCPRVLFLLFSIPVLAQSQYTPYDEISGINKSYKPVYREDYPTWGKMLYQYPINFNVIHEEFKRTETEDESEKSASPLKRYFLFWRNVISNHVDAAGNITIPDDKENRKRRYESQINSQKTRSSARVQREGNWSFLGPKSTLTNRGIATKTFDEKRNWQTNIYCFDIASNERSTLYAGSETGYLSKSVDGGESWSLIQGYNFFGAIEALAIHPTQNNIVYAASSDGQLHKTMDSGGT